MSGVSPSCIIIVPESVGVTPLSAGTDSPSQPAAPSATQIEAKSAARLLIVILPCAGPPTGVCTGSTHEPSTPDTQRGTREPTSL